VRQPLEPSRGWTIGFVLPLPFGGPLAHRLSVGGAFYTPSRVLLHGDVLFPEVVQLPVLARSQVVSIQAGVGLDLDGLVDGLRLGVGASALADLIGTVTVQLDETNAFTSEVETQLLGAYAPILGAQYTRGPIDLGFVFRGPIESRMSLDVEVRDLPVTVPLLSVGGLVQYDPATLSLEASWRPRERLRLVAGATWRRWSRWPGPQQRTSKSSNLAPAPDFSDTVSPRVAVEGTVRLHQVDLVLRGGYAWEPTPAPPAHLAPGRDSTGAPRVEDGAVVQIPLRYVDSDRHVLTAGAGIAAELAHGRRVSFDVYGQLQIVAPRTHELPAPGGSAPMESSGVVLAAGWSAGLQW